MVITGASVFLPRTWGVCAVALRRARAVAVALVLALSTVSAPAATAADASTSTPADSTPLPTKQLDPRDDLGREFPVATFEFVAVGVPDPRVPRHQRAYEFSVGAIMSGMADNGYELDRYWFPWVDYKTTGGKVASQSSGSSTADCSGVSAAEKLSASAPVPAKATDATATSESPRSCFGMMIFRLDTWRDVAPEATGEKVRIVYLLPETVTYGVQPAALAGAVAHVGAHLPAASTPLWHSQCAADTVDESLAQTTRRLLVAGPVFSGSSASYATALRQPLAAGTSVCLLAYSATATSNSNLVRTVPQGSRFQMASLTIDDDSKRQHVFETANQFGFDPGEVLFFVEKSTFGNSVCPATDAEHCRYQIDSTRPAMPVNVILFDSNIAELRERHAEQSAKGADNQLVDMMSPHVSHVLRVDDMSENGSEYPISRHSSMNIAGNDLALGRQIARLRHFGSDPRMVVVAATEVRDRLYLITAIKEAMPWVVTVDLESDILLSHPDFIPATRGTLTFGSAHMQLGRALSMQSDAEVLLRNLVGALRIDPAAAPVSAPSLAVIDIVGRNGLRPIAFGSPDANPWETAAPLFIALREHVGALLLALGLIALPPWKRIRGRWRVLRSHRLVHKLDIGTRAMAITLLLGTAAALMLAVIVAWYVLVDQKNELLDKVLICVLLAIALWIGRQLHRSAQIRGLPRRSLARRMRVWARWQLLRTLPGRTLALGIVFGAVACSVLTLKQAGLLWNLLEAKLNACAGVDPSLQMNLLDVSVTDGLAIAVTSVGAITVTIYAMCVASSIASLRGLVRPLWTAVIHGLHGTAPLSAQREVHNVSCMLIWLFMFPAVYFLSSWTPLGLSGLGVGYDVGFYIAMIATATTTLGALALIVGYLERLLQRCNEIVRWSRNHVAGDQGKAPFLGDWHEVGTTRTEFGYTPMVTPRPDWFPTSKAIARAAVTLRAALTITPTDSIRAREALGMLLASEIAVMRTLLALAMLSCFAGVLLVYAFPVPRRDALLFIDLALMIVTAVISAYATVRLERHVLISRILCDQAEGIQLSLSLIRALVLPFVIIALSLLIAEVPGVREWSGSYLGSLLKVIGGGR